VLDPREGKTIMNCTDPAAAARPGMKFVGLIAKLMDPTALDPDMLEDVPDVGNLAEDGDLVEDVGDRPA
jgi:hypothetical protein